MSYDFNRIAENIANLGIQHAFGITGSGNSLALIGAIQKLNIDYHPVNHEAAAALMAGAVCHDGLTRAISISIKGPGFANLLPGILSNHYESRPALSVSESYSSETPAFQMHKRLDHKSMVGGVTKGIFSLDANGDCIAEAVKLSCSETPGPCHIEMASVPDTPGKRSESAPNSNSKQSSLETALIRIRESQRPVVILGSWVRRCNSSIDWNGLNLPVVTTAAAKGCIDETRPFFAGIITGEESEFSPETNVLQEADLVVAFGLRNNEVVKPRTVSCPLLAIDEVSQCNTAGFSPTQTYTVATTHELEQLASALSKKGWGEKLLAKWRSKLDAWVLQPGWQPGTALRLLEQTFSDAHQQPGLVLDTGFFCTIGETVWRCKTGDQFVSSSVGRFMGISIPTAIGLAIKDPGRPVICIAGDGGIPPYVSEISLAVDKHLPVLFVLMSDGGYGSVASFSDSTPAVRRATTSLIANWSRSIEAMGCCAQQVRSEAQLLKSVLSWKSQGGPMFLELKFDPDVYRKIAKRLR